ncbi:LysR family transcriptional regulator [Nibricoccus aquaticus]|uniref:LysR family transcriptional regulator n=1 Tax=Nibricoccus aquaticus TaxID=2576891 RepID=A0A290QAF4_9BACT|nr:LysR substrate-binding domain-containing protein [Nibricoccus aquaticus]ATC65237.1 LysR family transcriptional regulator [Nibricoccus aquaticus]
MEIHQLRYFLAVAQTKNFSRAAERCHVAQPSLSQQIMKLEDELGEKLFERNKREFAITPAGELFLHHAERVIDELEAAREKMRDVRGLVRGKVELGALPTVAPYLLPALLKAFGARHPGIEVSIHEDTTANLGRAIDSKDLDLAIISAPAEGRRVISRELFIEPLWLALPSEHPLTRKRTLSAADLEKEPFIVMQESHCLGGQALQFCQSRGFAPNVSFRSAQIETVHAFVAAGLGISLVPAMALRADGFDGVTYRTLKEKPVRQIALIHHNTRPLSRAAKAFAEFLPAHLKSPARR